MVRLPKYRMARIASTSPPAVQRRLRTFSTSLANKTGIGRGLVADATLWPRAYDGDGEKRLGELRAVLRNFGEGLQNAPIRLIMCSLLQALATKMLAGCAPLPGADRIFELLEKPSGICRT